MSHGIHRDLLADAMWDRWVSAHGNGMVKGLVLGAVVGAVIFLVRRAAPSDNR
jgi:hypothetical protein